MPVFADMGPAHVARSIDGHNIEAGRDPRIEAIAKVGTFSAFVGGLIDVKISMTTPHRLARVIFASSW